MSDDYTAGYCKGCRRNTLLVAKRIPLVDAYDNVFQRKYFECKWCGFQNIVLREVREDYPDVRSLILRGLSPLNNW